MWNLPGPGVQPVPPCIGRWILNQPEKSCISLMLNSTGILCFIALCRYCTFYTLNICGHPVWSDDGLTLFSSKISNWQHPLDHGKSKRVPEKHLLLLYWLHRSFVWITTNCGKFFKRWEYQTTWSASWEIFMQVRKQQLELDMEKQTGSKSGKEYVKAVYCHPAYLTYMQSTSWETLDWKKHKLESRLSEKYQ